MSSELFLSVEAFEPNLARGTATRHGFDLGWTAAWNGSEWLVEVPPGHSLGPGGKGAFEIVTDDDWPRFVCAVQAELKGGAFSADHHAY